jgi:hypothetical protein
MLTIRPVRFSVPQRYHIPLLVPFVASLQLLVAAQTVVAQPASPRREVIPDRIGVRVKVDSGLRLRKRDLVLLRSVALRLLFGAGVETRWVEPGTTQAGRIATSDVDVVSVRVARGKHPGRSDICGEVAPHPPAPARPDITLYAGCIAGTVDRLWRWPRIGALEWGAVAGVVLAHEVAHVLGAVHASTGIMRANLGVAEWQAFVAGTLAFSENDAAQLRAARLDDASGQSASVSWWRSDL